MPAIHHEGACTAVKARRREQERADAVAIEEQIAAGGPVRHPAADRPVRLVYDVSWLTAEVEGATEDGAAAAAERQGDALGPAPRGPALRLELVEGPSRERPRDEDDAHRHDEDDAAQMDGVGRDGVGLDAMDDDADVLDLLADLLEGDAEAPQVLEEIDEARAPQHGWRAADATTAGGRPTRPRLL